MMESTLDTETEVSDLSIKLLDTHTHERNGVIVGGDLLPDLYARSRQLSYG